MSNKATTTTTIKCLLESGKTVTLTAADCAAIFNAAARRRLIAVSVEGIPSGFTELWSEDCCAVAQEGQSGDDEVVLVVNAADWVCGTPVKKAKKPKRVKK